MRQFGMLKYRPGAVWHTIDSAPIQGTATILEAGKIRFERDDKAAGPSEETWERPYLKRWFKPIRGPGHRLLVPVKNVRKEG